MTAISPDALDLAPDHAPGHPAGASTRPAAAPPGLAARLRLALLDRSLMAFAGVGLLAAIVDLWNLTASGFANAYYSAAALAASQSWRAWFFGSLDAGNFITVDKPPLATMLMGLSVRLFGLSSASILLPEALLGIGSVLLLFSIVRRQFGTAAATIAGVVFALTPVVVLMFRYDHPDALLTFLMLVAAAGTQRAIERGRHRWLVLAGIALGLAFLTKYLQGFLVLPAIVLAYAVAADASIRRRIAGLAILGTAVLATGGAWVAAVQLTPASLRPFIGGSTNNSVLDLVLGYDGLGRIFGASAGGQGGATFSGTPGLLRLFNSEFGGQIAWLLPFAVVAAAIGLVLTLRARRTDVGRAGYLLWSGWLAVHAIVFSFMSGIVHSYYAVAMAPAVGALVGAGTVALWRLRERSWFGGALLGASTALSAGLAALLLERSPAFVPWLAPAVLGAGLVAGAMLALPIRDRRYGLAVGALAVAVVLAGPAAFSISTIGTAYQGSIVAAGPSATTADVLSGTGTGPGAGSENPDGQLGTGLQGDFGPGGFAGGTPPTGGTGAAGAFPGGLGSGAAPDGGVAGSPGTGSGTTDSALAAYLVAHRGSATWVVAVSNAMTAAQLELETRAPVMAMGGWSGNDKALTLAQLKADLSAGALRYVVVGGQGGQGSNSTVMAWVEAHGTLVTVAGSSATLYDLSGAVGA